MGYIIMYRPAMRNMAMKLVVIDRMINMIEAKTHHEPLENVTHDHIRFQVIPRGSTGNF